MKTCGRQRHKEEREIDTKKEKLDIGEERAGRSFHLIGGGGLLDVARASRP
jgi:hypothetical protein